MSLQKQKVTRNRRSIRKLTVYLETLIASILNNNSTAFIRIITDTGSRNSYISKTETIRYGLFGGVEISSKQNRSDLLSAI